jgi:hypothetical protein
VSNQDDKTALRAASVGQDFGADTAAFDPAAAAPAEEVSQDHRGTVMVEFESYERIVEGLKRASDGARNMARWSDPDLWNTIAGFFDQLRRAIVQLSGYNRLQDAKDSAQAFGGEGLSRSDAQSRILTGLRDAEGGASQIAQAQRMDLRWHYYATQFRSLRDKANKLAVKGSVLAVASQWGGHTDRVQ